MTTLNYDAAQIQNLPVDLIAASDARIQIAWMMLNTVTRKDNESGLEHFQRARAAWVDENDTDCSVTFHQIGDSWGLQ